MKTQGTTSLLCVFLAGLSVATEAARERMTVDEDGIDFTVDRYDDGRSNPFVVKFTENDVSATFRFSEVGKVAKINAGSEKYKVFYESNGDLESVSLTSSRRRDLLAGEEALKETTMGLQGKHHGRNLYACADCVDAWDMVCDEGVPTVCDLVGYGSPILTDGASSIQTMCETFGAACSGSGGIEACDGQCEGSVEPTPSPVATTPAPVPAPIGGDVNPCLDPSSDEYVCNFDGEDTAINFSDCGLVDADTAYWPACFDNFGRENIVRLWIHDGEITTLPEGVFAGLSNLYVLSFFRQNLESLPEGIFDGLGELFSLSFRGNELTTVPAGIFSDLGNLDSLSLFECQLTSLPEGAFEGLDNLDDMNLDYNQLTSLPAAIFAPTPGLSYIGLTENQLTTLPEGLFADLDSMNNLYLDGNPDLQCLPEVPAGDVYLDSEDIRDGTCECEPAAAVMCDAGTTCAPGTSGYTCE